MGQRHINLDGIRRRRFILPFTGDMPLPDDLSRAQDFFNESGPRQREHQIPVGQRTAILRGGVELHIERKIALLVDTNNPADFVAASIGSTRTNVEYHHPRLTPRRNTDINMMRRQISVVHLSCSIPSVFSTGYHSNPPRSENDRFQPEPNQSRVYPPGPRPLKTRHTVRTI